MIGTEKIEKWRRWYSIKAVMILNCVEVVFWIALIVINCMSVNVCSGLGCTLSGLTIFLGFVLAYVPFPLLLKTSRGKRTFKSESWSRFLAVPIAYVSVRHYYHYKRNGVHPHEGHHLNAGKTLPMTQSTQSTSAQSWKQ